MFILKFFKGLKSQKKPIKPYSLQEIPSQISEIKVIDIKDSEESLDKGEINIETASLVIDNLNENQQKVIFPLIKKEKILIKKNKPGSYIDVNNPESWRNSQKKNKGKNVSIEPLKVKFKEKGNKKPTFILKTQGKKKGKKTDSTIFDKIDKILAKSTVNREKNDEKAFIELLNKNIRKSKSLIPQKKNNYLPKFFGEKNKKTKEIAEVKKTNKSLIQQNHSNDDFEENSMRIVEWKEANSFQEIQNTKYEKNNEKIKKTEVWERFSLVSQNKIQIEKSNLDAEYEKIEILHHRNDLALKDYLYIKENLIKIQKKQKA